MRGGDRIQSAMFSYLSPETRVRKEHPLRAIRGMVDSALGEMSPRRIKHRIRSMLGFKQFETAAITISGIELAEKIRKDQFKTGKVSGRPRTAPEIWAAILAA